MSAGVAGDLGAGEGNLRRASAAYLRRRAAARAPEYLRELEAAIVRRDPDGAAWIDVDHPAFSAMQRKYAAVRQLEREEFDVEEERRRASQGGCCGQPAGD